MRAAALFQVQVVSTRSLPRAKARALISAPAAESGGHIRGKGPIGGGMVIGPEGAGGPGSLEPFVRS